ncbi:MAG: hypothetical protein GX804_04845 [Lentisphaerae bacterium]|jgi:hypothetical protein|nr:hypothetical protein [Lentisphaerota bacterium]
MRNKSCVTRSIFPYLIRHILLPRVAVLLMCVLVMALPADASIKKLQTTKVSLFSLLLENFDKEGKAFNSFNREGELPVFHSVSWNPETRILNWRFLTAGDGELSAKFGELSQTDAMKLAEEQLNNVALFIGLVSIPGLEQPIGVLDNTDFVEQGLLTEGEWRLTRRQLASASVIHLAVSCRDGQFVLLRQSDGKTIKSDLSEIPEAVDKERN